MKQAFKPLGIAAAVAAASVGYVGVANAQAPDPSVGINALGDMALVPYYTVNGDWITGVHIVNTSDRTQVIKFRFRRASDSLDALDFNVVLSPQDVYAGFLSDDENGTIRWSANDTSCTVPETDNGILEMPSIYRTGAETGYIEIIGMGSPVAETETIALAAKHTSAGVPLDCTAVRSNFFPEGTSPANPGVADLATTHQAVGTGTGLTAGGENNYVATDDVLKVSYFIRDNASGVEFGDNAVHIHDFLNVPSMTNQQFGWLSGDLDGFDFPNLNGTAWGQGALSETGRFAGLRAFDALGVQSLANEWTANEANGAALSWVVTMPGQYTMMDTPEYVLAAESTTDTVVCTEASGCDYRDIPVTATVTPYNREEATTVQASGELTVSPALPGEAERTSLSKEVNVITFGGNNVLGVSDVDITAPELGAFGWLSLAVESQRTDLRVCAWDIAENVTEADGLGPQIADASLALLQSCVIADGAEDVSAGGLVPIIGFAAWARNVAANPDASYGRIVAHSFVSSS